MVKFKLRVLPNQKEGVMEYFLSHIMYVAIVAIILGFLAFVTVLIQAKNESGKTEEEKKIAGCNFNCASCMNHIGDKCDQTEKQKS